MHRILWQRQVRHQCCESIWKHMLMIIALHRTEEAANKGFSRQLFEDYTVENKAIQSPDCLCDLN